MTKKRKTAVNEDKTYNGCLEATSTREKLHPHTTDNTNAAGPRKVENSVKQNSNLAALEKNPKVLNMVVRRSQRLKSAVPTSENPLAEHAVEHVNLVENEKEDKAPNSSKQVDIFPIVNEKNFETEAHVESPLPETNEGRLEGKVDYLITVVDEVKYKVMGSPNKGSSPDLSYKSMYFNSQKKIEALVEENYNLVRKLEFAHGKIAAYEAMKEFAAKEVYLVSALGKATEAAASLSPQPVPRCIPSPPPAAIADDPKHKKSHQKKKKPKT